MASARSSPPPWPQACTRGPPSAPGYGVFGAALAPSTQTEWYDWIYCGGATLLALSLAAFSMWGRQIGAGRLLRSGTMLVAPLRRLHTGRVGDYTAALTLGVGVLGGLLMLTLR